MPTNDQVLVELRGIMSALGFPTDDAHLVGPVAWALAEGGWLHNDATYNPWNTTEPAAGSTSINSAGVQAYTSESEGIDATVRTLHNGRYPGVLSALAAGSPNQLADALGTEPWGTPKASVLACIAEARTWFSTPAPTPAPPKKKGKKPMLAFSADGKSIAAVRDDGHLIVATVGPSGGWNDAGLNDLTDRGVAADPAAGHWTFPTS